MQKYSTVYTKNDVKHSTVVVQPELKYGKNNSWCQQCISRIYAIIWVSIEPEVKYEGFGGGPLLVGGLGPGPPVPPPLKSDPATTLYLGCFLYEITFVS